MRKSKIFIIISLVLVFLFFVSCYLFYNSLFPKAQPIESPHPDTVLSFAVNDHNGNEIIIDNYLVLYDFILNAEPTRIMSVNDYPDTRPFYEVSIFASMKSITNIICTLQTEKTILKFLISACMKFKILQ